LEQDLHSGRRFDKALICAGVQPNSLALRLDTMWPATKAPDWV
jgi:hypothetical protein